MGADLLDGLKGLLAAPGIGRPFLAVVENEGRHPTLTVHAARSSMSRQQAVALRSRLLAEFGLKVRIRRHSRWTLQRARSLEGFLRPFARGRIVFDPTGIFERGSALVEFAQKARLAAGHAVKKLLWHSTSGSLFVVLDHRRVAESDRLSDIEQELRSEVRGLEASGRSGFVHHVRVGFHAPHLPATPVDALSAGGRLRPLAGLGKGAVITSLAAGLGFGAVAARAEDAFNPAVSGINGEVGVMGGLHSGTGAFVVEGAVSVPVGHQFGTRWDAMVATINGTAVGGVAGHLFWRDPEVALIGIAGGVLASNAPLVGGANQVAVFAVEAEAYLDDLTLSGLAGFQVTGTPANDGVVARLDLEWYATNDLMISAGVETNPQVNLLGRLGVEYRPAFEALPGLSVFAEGAVGTAGYHRVLGGIRFYFGDSETLRDKHRRDTFRSHLLPTRMIDSLPSSRMAYGS